MFRWTFANVSTIARCRQRDQGCIQELETKLRTALLSFFGASVVHRLDTNQISAFLYYLFTTTMGSKTLGEEYCQILPVDIRERSLPTVAKRILFTIWQLFKCPKWLEPLLPFHLVLFYWSGRYAEVSRRILGLRYINYPPSAPRPVADRLYQVMSVALLLVTTIRAYQYYCYWPSDDLKSMASDNIIPEIEQCRLCLERRRDTAVTPCGHLFCWTCLCHWLWQSPQCPLCRRSCQLAEVYCIKDPFISSDF